MGIRIRIREEGKGNGILESYSHLNTQICAIKKIYSNLIFLPQDKRQSSECLLIIVWGETKVKVRSKFTT